MLIIETWVDVNGLFESVANIAGAVDTLRAGQVNEVKLGAQVVGVGVVGGVELVEWSAAAHARFGLVRPALLHRNGEYRVGATGLFVHQGARDVSLIGATLEAGHDLLQGSTHNLLIDE